ncbi:MAG: sulfite oxidase-like oxidoreductase [Fervidicoccaceae archaeon]
MQLKCFISESASLSAKGIDKTLNCYPTETIVFEDINTLKKFIETQLKENIENSSIVFSENESLGEHHMLYKFNLMIGDARCASIRAVLKNKKLISIVIATSKDCSIDLAAHRQKGNIMIDGKNQVNRTDIPPGQYVIQDFVIYRILGEPKIDLRNWKLRVTGEVRNPLELSYDDLMSLGIKDFISDFHCVTGWTVKKVHWSGVPASELGRIAVVKKEAKWVLAKSADGYTTVIPIENFLSENSIIVLKMNGKVLTEEQGFPARLFIPDLYGWKGAKWLTEIEFRKDYEDGYWEALGYHERGNVWNEERFKEKIQQ